MATILSEKVTVKTDSGFRWGTLLRRISTGARGRSAQRPAEVPAPPPYKVTSSPSSATLVPAAEKADAKARRTRRLSKPRTDSVYFPTMPGSAHTSVTSIASPQQSPVHPPPKSKSPRNLDSSGRPRPPVSGTPPAKSSGHHDYHYKRTRTSSSSETSRIQEAILCLQAVVDACEAGAVKDVKRIVEQVVLARNILVGEESAVLHQPDLKLLAVANVEPAPLGSGTLGLVTGAPATAKISNEPLARIALKA